MYWGNWNVSTGAPRCSPSFPTRGPYLDSWVEKKLSCYSSKIVFGIWSAGNKTTFILFLSFRFISFFYNVVSFRLLLFLSSFHVLFLLIDRLSVRQLITNRAPGSVVVTTINTYIKHYSECMEMCSTKTIGLESGVQNKSTLPLYIFIDTKPLITSNYKLSDFSLL